MSKYAYDLIGEGYQTKKERVGNGWVREKNDPVYFYARREIEEWCISFKSLSGEILKVWCRNVTKHEAIDQVKGFYLFKEFVEIKSIGEI